MPKCTLCAAALLSVVSLFRFRVKKSLNTHSGSEQVQAKRADLGGTTNALL